jgi:hypothetical protein
MTIQTAQIAIQEMYKNSQITGSAPRFESINGTKFKLVLTFVSLTGRNTMDSDSLKNIIRTLENIFSASYKITGFSIGRSNGSIVLENVLKQP